MPYSHTSVITAGKSGPLSESALRGIPVKPYERLVKARSLLESPILDDHKWSKVPNIPADAVLLDMEDSASPSRKLEARSKVIEYLHRPEFFGGRPVLPRVNSLGTPWGLDDLLAIAKTDAELVLYPKVRSADE